MTNLNIMTLELDMVLADEELQSTRNGRITLQGAIKETLNKFSLKGIVAEVVGPAGGNPVIQVRGSKRGIRRYLTEVYLKGEPNEVESFMNIIKPYYVYREGQGYVGQPVVKNY